MIEKKSKIVDQAIETIDGFEKVFKVIHQNTVLQGKSKSTFHNYIRRIAITIRSSAKFLIKPKKLLVV